MIRLLAFVLLTGLGVAVSLAFAASPFDPPVRAEFVKSGVYVIWHETNDVQAICGPRALACAVIGEPCTIYTYPNPSFDTLGHELLHCLRGRWH